MKKLFLSILGIILIMFLIGCKSDTTQDDIKLVNQVYESLEVPTTIKENINLISEKDGVKVTWESSNELYLSNVGTVNRFSENNSVVLTAKIEKNKISKHKNFDVIVEKDDDLTSFKNLYISNSEEVSILGVSIIATNEGFYLYNKTYSILVKTKEDIPINSLVKVTGNIVIEEYVSKVIALKIEIIKENIENTLNIDNKSLNAYTSIHTLSSISYSTVISSFGVIYVQNDEVYIKYNRESIKLSNKNLDEIVDLVKSNRDNKIYFIGIFDRYNVDTWEIVLADISLVKFENLKIGEKQSEVISWIEHQLPSVIDEDYVKFDFPTKHPIFGGEISWTTDNSNGKVLSDGTVVHGRKSSYFTINYDLKMPGLAIHRGSIEILYSPDVIYTPLDFITEQFYNTAKCNESEVEGVDCWDEYGNYIDLENIFNVVGKVLYKLGNELYLTDPDYIDYSVSPKVIVLNTSLRIASEITVGDIVTFGATTYNTKEFQPYLNSTILVDIEVAELDNTQISKKEIIAEESINLDMQNFETYATVYKIKQVYLTNLVSDINNNNYAYTTPKNSNTNPIAGETIILIMEQKNKELFQELDWNISGVYLDIVGIATSSFINGNSNMRFNTLEVPSASNDLTNDQIAEMIKVRFQKSISVSTFVLYNYNNKEAQIKDNGFSNRVANIYTKITSIKGYDSSNNELSNFLKEEFVSDFNINSYMSKRIWDEDYVQVYKLEVTFVLTDSNGNEIPNAEYTYTNI